MRVRVRVRVRVRARVRARARVRCRCRLRGKLTWPWMAAGRCSTEGASATLDGTLEDCSTTSTAEMVGGLAGAGGGGGGGSGSSCARLAVRPTVYAVDVAVLQRCVRVGVHRLPLGHHRHLGEHQQHRVVVEGVHCAAVPQRSPWDRGVRTTTGPRGTARRTKEPRSATNQPNLAFKYSHLRLLRF